MLASGIQNKKEIYWFYIIGTLFVITNGIMMGFENYYLNLLPLILLIVYWAFYSMDKLLMMIVFFTPLSVTFRELLERRVEPDLSMPTEPLLFGATFLFILKILQGQKFDIKILKHPVSIAIIVYLGWLLLTSLTSTMPIVSLKFFAAKIWFIIPFYFLGTQLFKDQKNMKKFLWLYIIPLIGVITYTIIHHSQFYFEELPANWVVKPFYNDHTEYAAALAMFIPVIIGFLFIKKYSPLVKAVTLLILGIFILATVLSYTRAAWVSLAAAIATLIVLMFKLKFKYIVFIIIALAGAFIVYQDQIIMKMEENKQDSSDNFSEHVESISNISTDASNKERLNRWSCAIRMFKVKPLVGFGPGTYQFNYGPFQANKDKTIISTNQGTAGNAHSEYLGPLSESGLFGMLNVIMIVLLSIATGFRLFYSLKDKHLKLITCVILLGLVTYFTHGFLNNFLDSDKASVPVWGFIAMLVAIDVYHNKKEEKLLEPAAE